MIPNIFTIFRDFRVDEYAMFMNSMSYDLGKPFTSCPYHHQPTLYYYYYYNNLPYRTLFPRPLFALKWHLSAELSPCRVWSVPNLAHSNYILYIICLLNAFSSYGVRNLVHLWIAKRSVRIKSGKVITNFLTKFRRNMFHFLPDLIVIFLPRVYWWDDGWSSRGPCCSRKVY